MLHPNFVHTGKQTVFCLCESRLELRLAKLLFGHVLPLSVNLWCIVSFLCSSKCLFPSFVQSTTISDLIHRGVKEFYPEKFVVSPPE